MKVPTRLASTTRPIVYELDTRAWLAALSRRYGRNVRLGDVPDGALKAITGTGCDMVWLMGVWRTGAAGRKVARSLSWLATEARTILPDFTPRDIVGSPYAIADYEVASSLGGDEGLASLRRRLARVGVGVVLDFVPNHTALDHPWVHRHPDWYVRATPERAASDPSSWFPVRAGGPTRFLAHGRDPNLPAWPDTAQLDYRVPEVRAAMSDVLLQIATRCDAIRCDMAMLELEDVFCATWQSRVVEPASGGDVPAGEFWWHAIRALRTRYPNVIMIAESYWGLEYRLQQMGFDYTYDKTLLDRLRDGNGVEVAAHLRADADYQRRSVRFLENHDEPRAAASMSPSRLRAAAVVVAAVPGMLLLHDGQLDGARFRTPVELGRRPDEPIDVELRAFYERLLAAVGGVAVRRGTPIRLDPRATWEGDSTHAGVVAWLWVGPRRSFRLMVANLGPTTARCFLPIRVPDFAGRTIVLEDLLSDARYERDGSQLLDRGLYLEMPPDGHHLFRFRGHGPGALKAVDTHEP
ncbi:MAG: alpha-amylase family glycosyl hydrolase [Chloroflexota bacterium]